jgi:hypothetical protein
MRTTGRRTERSKKRSTHELSKNENRNTNHHASHHERHMQHQGVLHVGIVFRLEHIGSTDLAAATNLGTKFSQVSLLFVFREEPRLFLKEKRRNSKK